MMSYETLRRNTILAAAAALIIPAAATYGQDADRNRGQDQSGQTVITGQERSEQDRRQGQQRVQISPDEAQEISRKFFESQASGNQFEIEAAKLAREKASDDQIKQLAEMIIEGHEKAQEILREEAGKVGAEISENPELKEVHSATLDALKQKEGEEFDRAYVFEQDADHLKNVLLLRYVQSGLPNDAAKSYARQVLPEVERHARQLDELASDISGYDIQWDQARARTAGGRVGDAPGQPDQEAAQRDRAQRAQQERNQDQERAQVDAEKWFEHAASADRYMNEAAKLASERSNDSQVKSIAEQIQRDHEQSRQRLMEQAREAGADIGEEPELLPLYEARLDALKEIEGPAFDAHYTFDAAATHRMGLLEYTWASQKANNEQVRNFSQEAIRTLEQHQRQIRRAAESMTGQGRAQRSQPENRDR